MKWRCLHFLRLPRRTVSLSGALSVNYTMAGKVHIYSRSRLHTTQYSSEKEHTHTHTHAKTHTRTQSQECQDNSTISKDPARTGIIVKHKPRGARWIPHGKPQSRWSPESYSIYCVLSINVRTLDDIWHNRHLCKESWLHSNKIKKNKKNHCVVKTLHDSLHEATDGKQQTSDVFWQCKDHLSQKHWVDGEDVTSRTNGPNGTIIIIFIIVNVKLNHLTKHPCILHVLTSRRSIRETHWQ